MNHKSQIRSDFSFGMPGAGADSAAAPPVPDKKAAADFAGVYGGNDTAPAKCKYKHFDIDLTVDAKGTFKLFVDTVDKEYDGWRILWDGTVVRVTRS